MEVTGLLANHSGEFAVRMQPVQKELADPSAVKDVPHDWRFVSHDAPDGIYTLRCPGLSLNGRRVQVLRGKVEFL